MSVAHVFEITVVDEGTGPDTHKVLVGVDAMDAVRAVSFAQQHAHNATWWRWRIVTGVRYVGPLMALEVEG